jgi:hypothetical protein
MPSGVYFYMSNRLINKFLMGAGFMMMQRVVLVRNSVLCTSNSLLLQSL